MSIKKLRHKKNISQELLAETVGLGLRTIQRAESGENIANSSWSALAEYFEVSMDSLKASYVLDELIEAPPNRPDRLGQHRAAQFIIFSVTFFVCIGQWMAYYAYLNDSPGDASLGTILSYLSQIALGAAIFVYLFNRAKVTFVWSYYITVAAFVLCAIGINYWTLPIVDSDTFSPLFPVFYTLMLLTLVLFHVLQVALSLKGESVVFIAHKTPLTRGVKSG
jgi:transcriptional regulator with XRE-family HTH domain